MSYLEFGEFRRELFIPFMAKRYNPPHATTLVLYLPLKESHYAYANLFFYCHYMLLCLKRLIVLGLRQCDISMLCQLSCEENSR